MPPSLKEKVLEPPYPCRADPLSFSNVQIDDVVIISGSPGLQTSAEREARAQHDDRLAEELTEAGAPTFIQTWYEAPMWER